jgi:AraC-like DNA-binding protein
MKQPSIPRGIMLPPLGRPRWMAERIDESELFYLSWGDRKMGEHPIPLAMHDGWSYAVILEGGPTLRMREMQAPLQAGDVFIFDPNCAFGWLDSPGCSSQLLTWIWRDPPTHSKLIPETGGLIRLHADGERLRHLVRIHQQCRRDVGPVGEITMLSLRRARLDLDICLAGILRPPESGNEGSRMNLALHFLRQNPGVKYPVKSLCAYLKIDARKLRELFLHHCGHSPQAVAHEIRMIYARERLGQPGVSVKEVASELGYSHANDLSRAYKKHFGTVTARRTPRLPVTTRSRLSG